MKVLVVVDMQNDFIDGSLGTPEAVAIVPSVIEKIKEYERGDSLIIYTKDTHFDNYLETSEGRNLPVEHCIKGTVGFELNEKIAESLKERDYKVIEKPTFGSVELPKLVEEMANGEDFDVTLIGLCTDICVVSNALLLKANFPEKTIKVDSTCCAGVTPETHNNALSTMRMCQIEIL